ncbi:MAG: hypothetical protein KF758_01130 [Anaerolineales bacterium]|nr:hypothetical protein [Anaerolineales bacterium]
MIGVCRLCKEKSDLQLSHIVPKFVFSWLKETSASPIRHSQNPNVRVQDGEKIYLLCSDCENLFSKWENLFAQNVFHPLQKEQQDKRYLQYGKWCLKFAVSVSWRVLAYGREKGIQDVSDEQLEKVDEALSNWEEYLLSSRKSPAPFDQHLIPLTILENYSNTKTSPFMNRYFLRAVGLDIAYSNNRLFTYVKMGKIMLFGLVHEKHPNLWKNGKILLDRGAIGNETYILPTGIDDYLSNRANVAANISASLSQRQQEKVQEHAKENKDKIMQSEIFRAFEQDVRLFGDDAIRK